MVRSSDLFSSLYNTFDISTQRHWLPVLTCPNKEQSEIFQHFHESFSFSVAGFLSFSSLICCC
jgi:hypothetical protein